MKIRTVEAELFPRERTDMTKIIVAFRNFTNASKNSAFCPHNFFMCLVWLLQQMPIVYRHIIYRVVFLSNTKYIYCRLPTEVRNILQSSSTRLVAGLSPQRLEFIPGLVQVRFVVNKVALGEVPLRVLQFSPVSSIPPMCNATTFTFYVHVTVLHRNSFLFK